MKDGAAGHRGVQLFRSRLSGQPATAIRSHPARARLPGEARITTPRSQDLNTLLAKYPAAKEREAALQQKALILGQQDNPKGMSDAFRQLLKEFPKSSVAAQANYYIGKAAFEAKDYKGALAPLEAARQLNKEQYYNLATLRIVSAYFYLKDRAALTKRSRWISCGQSQREGAGGNPRVAWGRVLQRKELHGGGEIFQRSGPEREPRQREAGFLVLSRRRAKRS